MQARAIVPERNLAAAWKVRERFVVLATGPGSAARFLDAWRMWRADPGACRHLHWIALDAERIRTEDDDCGRALAAAWPPPSRNLHHVALDDGRVQLVLGFGSPAGWLRELVARVDFFLVAEPRPGEDWLGAEPRMARALARLAERNACLTLSRPGAGAVESLKAVGFRFDDVPNDADALQAEFQPSDPARTRIGRDRPHPVPNREVLVIGGGLAGCATAWALAEAGWRCAVHERGATLAGEASGNPAGLFHGIVNGQDGSHARFHRAAALQIRPAVQTALAEHAAAGQQQGLLQLADPPHTAVTMRAQAMRLGLPDEYVQVLDAERASARAGLALGRPAWFYPGGGWIDPAGLCRSFVARAGTAVQVHCDSPVEAIRRCADAWELIAADGHVISSAPTLVLANAGDALRLLGADWPVEPVRGQLSWLDDPEAASWPRPLVPVAGSGYVVGSVEGSLLFGATADVDDPESGVRGVDHQRNLAQLARLSPRYAATPPDMAALNGRTAWRWTSRDRLPLIGAAPVEARWGSMLLEPPGIALTTQARRADQARFVERIPGLYVYIGLGSRGITWSALGARILAATITGAPSPVEASLLDAVDPARFGVRALRRARISR